MYLKVHHTAEFITANINTLNGQIKELRGCYIEAKRMGVDVRVPSWRDFTGETITKNK